MTRIYSESEVVARVPGLSGQLLIRLIEAEVVRPVARAPEPCFHRVDLARLELACELAEQFDLEPEALGLVLDLVDRVHGLRREMRALMRVLRAEPEEVRARIAAALRDEIARGG